MGGQKGNRGPRTKRAKAKQPKSLVTFTSDEVNALVKACSRYPTGIRNRALIVLLYRSGLRIQEALDLQMSDLDPKGGSINVRAGKGGKQRAVNLDETANEFLQHWLSVRKKLKKPGAPVFCTLAGEPIWSSYIRTMLRRIGRKAVVEGADGEEGPINKRVHPHALRHTYARNLMNAGVSLSNIQLLLGHSSVVTTALYVNGVCPEHAIKAANALPAPEGW